ncbi:type II secretion system protein [Hathewaya histolytica]|uniref:type II secretion system protein n=1 Tax=Hathewaya histolytica TaxID=1498 RepID=UPI003B67DD95
MSFLKKLKEKKKGFTLIELIVVIAILGILAAILLPRFSGFTDSAREKTAMSEAKAIYTSLEAYYAENGQYPPADNGSIQKEAEGKKGLKDVKNLDKVTNYNSSAAADAVLFKYKKDDKITVQCTGSGTVTKVTTSS